VVRALVLVGVGAALAAFAIAVGVIGSATTSDGGSSSNDTLVGPDWQWEELVENDGTTVAPGDPSKYTVQFAADGSVTVQADCNRGLGTYTVGPETLTIEVTGVTRAACPEGSLGDRYLRELGFVRTYLIENGKLYLGLIADAGTLRHEAG
jgi:para-nitrobenzyl esterase